MAARDQTAAANEWRRQRYAESLATKLRQRLTSLDDKWLVAMAAVLWAECRMRGLNVPDLLEEDEEP